MAKLQLGPLVSRAQGAVGDEVYRQVGGQTILQGKGIPPRHTSARAMRTKKHAQLAGQLWQAHGAQSKAVLASLGRLRSKNGYAPWLGAMCGLMAGGGWNYPYSGNPFIGVYDIEVSKVGAQTRYKVNLRGDPDGLVFVYLGMVSGDYGGAFASSWLVNPPSETEVYLAGAQSLVVAYGEVRIDEALEYQYTNLVGASSGFGLVE